jgi:hypothetical protein
LKLEILTLDQNKKEFMKNNAYLREDEVLVIVVLDKDQTLALYGEDGLEEDGLELPEEFMERYKRYKIEHDAIQAKLQEFSKKFNI